MEAESKDPQLYAAWSVLELMGKTVVAGFVQEVTLAGATMLRMDVPAITDARTGETIPAWTKFYGAASIFACTPVGEDEAMVAARKLCARPISTYIVPAVKPLTPRLLTTMGGWEADEQARQDADASEDDRYDDDDHNPW